MSSCAGGGTHWPSLAAESPASAVSPTSSGYRAGARFIPSWRGRSAAADAFHLLHSDLDPVPVRPTSTTSQSGCYRLRKEDPVDLRVSRRHGRIPLSFLHELGHLVDHQLGRQLGNAWASGRHEAFADWRAAAASLPSRAPAGSEPRPAALLQLGERGVGARLRAGDADALG